VTLEPSEYGGGLEDFPAAPMDAEALQKLFALGYRSSNIVSLRHGAKMLNRCCVDDADSEAFASRYFSPNYIETPT
jgi:hypothetical protein